jgi:hypothetical protein
MEKERKIKGKILEIFVKQKTIITQSFFFGGGGGREGGELAQDFSFHLSFFFRFLFFFNFPSSKDFERLRGLGRLPCDRRRRKHQSRRSQRTILPDGKPHASIAVQCHKSVWLRCHC